MLVHKHLLLQARFLARGRVESYYETWMSILVERIGMEKLTKPKAVRSMYKGNKGITCSCMITTSHIVLHTWEENHPGLLQLDIYSCKDFNIEDVIDHLKNIWVDEHTIQYKYLDRENGFKELNEQS